MPTNIAKHVSLTSLSTYDDSVLLLSRLVLGAFLVWGVWDNISSTERMDEFVRFMTAHGFVRPSLMAHLSVYAQFLIGISFIVGLGIRWAGILCAINFIVAIVMVDYKLGIRGSFPSACLILFGLYYMTHGGGRWSLDYFLNLKATTTP
jgi:putative oxidoreductase